MPELVRVDFVGSIAVMTIDNPPVNALSTEVWRALNGALHVALGRDEVTAAVVMGAGATFVAGADINGFKALRTREDALARVQASHMILRHIEDAPKPIVAAIHGNALGGGLELAMACHYRVAVSTASLGQPEVLLGIIPGAGGTQRLPRLAGVALAIEMCVEGKPIRAAKAHSVGLIDAIVDDLRGDAIAFAQALTGIRRTRELPIDRVHGPAIVAAARLALRNALPAPRAAIDAIDAAITSDFADGARRERELFADCVVSTESRALRHLFFAERDATKLPDVPKDTPHRAIARAAVIGAGTMGGGIAMTYASAGIPVLLKDVDDAALERGMAIIRKNYASSVAKGKLSADDAERTIARIAPTTTYDGFDQVDIVVEAVFEDMALKQATFAELGRVTAPHCILATNTSTLDLDEFGAASGRLSHVVGHHFFSPANVMKLLEIVRGRETSAETLATSIALGKRLGKVGAVVGNCFGFVANRMLGYYMREALLLLEEGASVAQIDDALIAFGMPVGPFGMQDIAGIDVGARIRQYLASVGKTRAEGPQSEIPDRLFAMGRYGQKTGAGYYRYDAGSRQRIADPLIEELAGEAAAKRGIARRAVTDAEILARITTALANEGARVLEDGFALRASDIDVIYCYGFGFPRHRGGPMFYADTVGLAEVVRRIEDYRARLGDHWRPARLLVQLAAEGRSFQDLSAGRSSR